MLTIQLEQLTERAENKRQPWKKVVIRICDLVSLVLFIALLVMAVLLVIPDLFGFSSYTVMSGSMAPELPKGSMLYNGEFDFTNAQEGDIITYQYDEDMLVTHRIAEIDREAMTIQTKGDANQQADQDPIPANAVVGTYRFQIPYLGYVSIYGKTPAGMTVIVCVAVLVILLNVLPEILAKPQKQTVVKRRVIRL